MAKVQIGDVINKLTILRRCVLGPLGTWFCRCECGNEKEISHDSLRKGAPFSCGCVHGNIKHGHFKNGKTSRTASSYSAMMSRCKNINDKDFERYGAIEISVCDRWTQGHDGISGFECFLKDMGEIPADKGSIDRWPNGAGNYEPGNCRWANIFEQQNNLKSNRIFEFNGVKMSLADLGRATGIPRNTLKLRLTRMNWDFDRAITTPVQIKNYGPNTRRPPRRMDKQNP